MGQPSAKDVAAVAEEAGVLIMEHYRRADAGARDKSDGSPVTDADLAAEAFLRGELSRRWPWPIVSEETPPPPWSERRGWTRYWLVDPIDGTRDFVARTGEFCVNVALIEQDRPILGVVHAPALGVTWSAERGAGAYRVQGGQTRRLSARRDRVPWRGLKSRFHASAEAEAFYATHGIEEVVVAGSTMKICTVAEGGADAYAAFGPIKDWDVAPGDLIATEAGAAVRVIETDAAPVYNRVELRSPPLVFCSPRFLSRFRPRGPESSGEPAL